MKINSLLPPISFQSPVDGQWYIATTDKDLGWVKVERRYSWEELEKMWKKPTFKKNKEIISKKQTFSVEGSKGNKYTITNDKGIWTCSCPAHGFGRGKDCKHIKQIKSEK